MSLPRNIGRKVDRLVRRTIAAGALNTGDITLRWRQRTVLPADFDRHLETSAAGSEVEERTEVVKGFIHYVNIHTTGYTRHAEVRTGDVILDFPGDVEIDGREGLRFEIGGKTYVQKNGGAALAESWDVRCNNLPVTRTVLATLI